jgi:DNA (cytosine-5)-methyltransferase 1
VPGPFPRTDSGGLVITNRVSGSASGRASSARAGRPIGIDLFAGVGGLSLGFEQAGFDVVASVEYDPVHASVHAFNFPLTEVVCADISRLDSHDLLAAAKCGFERHGRDTKAWSGEIDVIFGGPPCQGFSTMGKRDVGDDRNRLVYKFASLIASVQPRYFVMENVPGMASGDHADILTRLIERFRKAGYEVAIAPQKVRDAILNAADYGVPQDRRRLILIGARDGEALPKYPPPTVQRVPKRSGFHLNGTATVLNLLPQGPSVWDAIGDVPDLDSFEELWNTDQVRLPRGKLARMSEGSSEYAMRLRGHLNDPEDFSHQRKWDSTWLTSSMRTEHTDESIRRFRLTEEGATEPISRFYRLDRYGLCNTIRAGTGSERGAYTSPRPLHPTLPRVISVREAARLHSFPDWFRFHRTKWHGFRSIGNAVPPLMGRAVAKSIILALGIRASRPSQHVDLGDSALLDLDRTSAAAYFAADMRHIPKTRKRLAS